MTAAHRVPRAKGEETAGNAFGKPCATQVAHARLVGSYGKRGAHYGHGLRRCIEKLESTLPSQGHAPGGGRICSLAATGKQGATEGHVIFGSHNQHLCYCE